MDALPFSEPMTRVIGGQLGLGTGLLMLVRESLTRLSDFSYTNSGFPATDKEPSVPQHGSLGKS